MSKSKEEIMQKHLHMEVDREKYPNGYPWIEESMDEYAKQQGIAFVKWKDGRGYLPFQKADSITPEWGWKRQENQITWSKWINDDQLYNLFIQHQSQQQIEGK